MCITIIVPYIIFYYKHDKVLLFFLWKIALVQQTVNFISYEPAGRTMQPPPRELLRVGSFLRMNSMCSQNNAHNEKLKYFRVIQVRRPENLIFQHIT